MAKRNVLKANRNGGESSDKLVTFVGQIGYTRRTTQCLSSDKRVTFSTFVGQIS